MALFCVALSGFAPCAGGVWLYQIPWHTTGMDGKPVIPKTAARAVESLPFRNAAVVRYLACGDEVHFLRSFQQKKSDTDMLAMVMGKMAFYAGLPNDRNLRTILELECEQTYRFAQQGGPDKPIVGEATPDEWQKLKDMATTPGGLGGGLNPDFASTGRFCSNLIANLKDLGNEIEITFKVSDSCLREQVNAALQQMSITGHMGSSGVPCHITHTLTEDEANWDFSVRDLMRVLYLDERYRSLRTIILDTSTRDYIRQKLIPLRPEMDRGDYSLLGCGNTEDASGDAEDRADEGNFLDDVWDGLGDIGDWLLHHWYITFPLAWASAATGGVVSQIPGATTTVVIGVGAADAIIQEVRVTETENHLLNIETSRYLNNQLTIRDLKADGDNDAADDIDSKQADVREWLLKRLQQIQQEDFIEFNSRPYQRESISAILGLYDFAEDADLRTASRMVLEYAFARFAVGSNQGRRLVPFRRRMEQVAKQIDDQNAGLFDLVAGADHQMALGLLYAGQTQQLPGNTVSIAAPGELIYAATSKFQMDERIIDFAIEKSSPYFQRFHHAGVEIYSSGKGFLITAGGIVADYAYSGPLDTFADANDRGAGVPTTLMFPGATGKMRRWSFLALDGRKESVQGSKGDPQISYDHNACVWRGFACGINFQIPSDLSGCLKDGPPGSQAEWHFLDVAQCPGYEFNPKVYVAIYNQDCGVAVDHCRDFGFFEAVDVPSGLTFDSFKSQVIAKNPPGFVVTPPTMRAGGGGDLEPLPLNGTYKTFGNKVIEFDCSAHLQDDDRSGIDSADGQSVEDLDDWPLAEGDLISATDEGLVTIRPRVGAPITLDFRKWNSPKRTP